MTAWITGLTCSGCLINRAERCAMPPTAIAKTSISAAASRKRINPATIGASKPRLSVAVAGSVSGLKRARSTRPVFPSTYGF
jgi:hypothetical protein